MATPRRYGRNLQELGQDVFETLCRSYELIQQSKLLAAQSKQLIRLSTSRNSNHKQEARKLEERITD